jgi:hypothetical protein
VTGTEQKSGTDRSIVTRFLAPLLVGGMFVVFLAVVFAGSRPDRPDATADLGPLADPSEVYNPVTAGEPLPEGFRQVLARDAILPIYAPEFTTAGDVRWADDTLVIGVALAEQAKAYPVSALNRREMVVDRLAGIPILVTW